VLAFGILLTEKGFRFWYPFNREMLPLLVSFYQRNVTAFGILLTKKGFRFWYPFNRENLGKKRKYLFLNYN
jgi:predicted branched-subunit amino acid permease